VSGSDDSNAALPAALDSGPELKAGVPLEVSIIIP